MGETSQKNSQEGNRGFEKVKRSGQKTRKRKPSEEGYHSREATTLLHLLEELYSKGEVELEKVQGFAPKDFTGDKIQSIIDSLDKSTLPTKKMDEMLVWESIFKSEDQTVGKRLFVNRNSKELLSRRVVDLLVKQGAKYIMIGAGTSALTASLELIHRLGEIPSLSEIYTNNVLALNELIRYASRLQIRVPEGRIEMSQGTIKSPEGISRLQKCRFDAVITSFNGLKFDEGFSSDDEDDKYEKLMNLHPENCSTIYIIMCWPKIGNTHHIVVKTEDGIDPEKKYIIVTNPPHRNWHNDPDQEEKVKEIGKWGDLIEKGIVRFEYVYNDE